MPETETNAEQLIQLLQDLQLNPVNVNNANKDDLLLIPGVNLKIADAIISYREKHDGFQSMEELLAVRGIGPVTLTKIKPYVTTGTSGAGKKAGYGNIRYWSAGGRLQMYSRVQQKLQKAEGYKRLPVDGGYVGNEAKYYQRTHYRSRHLSVNITQEKDPGEPMGGTAGLDYLSWHVALKDNGLLKDLVVGDYSLSFGQGLVLWSGGAFGKGRETVGNANRKERGIAPYTSAQETNFYRGGAVTLGGRLQLTGFYSMRKQSAAVVSGDTLSFPQKSGLYRTLNERGRQHNLQQELYGGNLRMEFPYGYVGATAYKTVFSKYIEGSNAVSDQYEFSGLSNTVAGINYRFMIFSSTLFGEVAASENRGYGLITGMESPFGEDTEITLAYRNYTKDFQSLMADGFGEASGIPRNEEGLYLGLRHAIGNRFTVSGYFDRYYFPAPRFGTIQPNSGYDWLGLLEMNIYSNLNIYLQVRGERKEDEYTVTDILGRSVRKLGIAMRRTYRIQLEHWVNKKIRLRSRGEYVQGKKGGEDLASGYLIYQDIRVLVTPKLKIDGRVTVFETDNFNARVYQFENDLLYVMSSEMLYGEGQRFYVLLNYEPIRFLEMWAKFGITIYEDQLTVGSGLEEIMGNRRSEVGAQVRLKF
nr:helix-hairpin-helix domain-containing protein [Halalkalibaculum roseum]